MKAGTVWAAPVAIATVPPHLSSPARSLRSWSFTLTLTQAQLFVLEIFWIGCMGSYQSFTYLDPIISNPFGAQCRFADDVLTMEFVGVNEIRVEVRIVEIA